MTTQVNQHPLSRGWIGPAVVIGLVVFGVSALVETDKERADDVATNQQQIALATCGVAARAKMVSPIANVSLSADHFGKLDQATGGPRWRMEGWVSATIEGQYYTVPFVCVTSLDGRQFHYFELSTVEELLDGPF